MGNRLGDFAEGFGEVAGASKENEQLRIEVGREVATLKEELHLQKDTLMKELRHHKDNMAEVSQEVASLKEELHLQKHLAEELHLQKQKLKRRMRILNISLSNLT